MNFPIMHCVETKHLTKQMYDLLLTKLITEGYHWPSNFDKRCFFDLWDYLGVNSYGTIFLYDNPQHFLEVDAEVWDNVLYEGWLMRYLK